MVSLSKINSQRYYHGTYLKDATSIKSIGFSILRRVGRGDSLGPGFYMSSDKSWALEYAQDIVDWEEKDAALLTMKINVSSFLDVSNNLAYLPQEVLDRYGDPSKLPIRWSYLGKIARELAYEAAGNPKGTIVVYKPRKVKVVDLEVLKVQ